MVKTETKQSDAEQLVRSKLDELIEFRSQTDDIKEFWGKQFDLGLAWVQYPEGAGGLGINPKYQLLVTEILREQGINGHYEMAAAFREVGFKTIDIHMTDLISKRHSLKNFKGIVACGGFSYGDVLGAGNGWATTILKLSLIHI